MGDRDEWAFAKHRHPVFLVPTKSLVFDFIFHGGSTYLRIYYLLLLLLFSVTVTKFSLSWFVVCGICIWCLHNAVIGTVICI